MTMLRAGVAWHVFALTGSAFHLGLIGLVQFLPALGLMLRRRRAGRHLRPPAHHDGGAGAWRCAGGLVLWARDARGDALTPAAPLRRRPRGRGRQRVRQPGARGAAADAGAARASSRAPSPSRRPTRRSPSRPARRSAAWSSPPPASPPLYAAYAVLLVGSLAALALASAGGRGRAAPAPSLAAIREGLAFVRRQPVVLGCMTLDMFAVIFGGATALLPIYAKRHPARRAARLRAAQRVARDRRAPHRCSCS